MPGLLQKDYGVLIAIAGTMIGQKAEIINRNGDFTTIKMLSNNDVNDLTMCICPYCNSDILINTTKDNTICPLCGNTCDIWADGDINFNSYYLTRLIKK